MNEHYLDEFERWVAGSPEVKRRHRAELEAHLRGADEHGELGNAMARLGTPREAARAFVEGHNFRPASIPRRLAAAVTDIATSFVLVAVGAAVVIVESPSVEVTRPGHLSVEGPTGPLGAIGFLLFVVAALWWVIGLTIMEWRYGRTPGKALWHLRVVAEDGTALSFGQAVVRRLTLVFSGPLQLIDWAFVFFNPKHQRGLDILAKTLVIDDGNGGRDAQPARAAASSPSA